MSVVDLTFVLVEDAIGLILQVWLVVASLRQDHNLHVAERITAALIHVVRGERRCALTDDDATGVASVGEVDRVLMLVAAHERAA